MICARDGSGGIEGMLHREYGIGNGVVDGTPTPLVDDTSGLTEISPLTLGMVMAGDETDEVSLTLGMPMR